MSKSNAFFMEKMEKDPAFRRQVELEEMRRTEPDCQSEDSRLEQGAHMVTDEDSEKPF